MWWCWNADAIELFRRINPAIWKETVSNPLEFLNRIPQTRFEALARDEGFLAHLNQVKNRYESEVLKVRNGIPGNGHKCIAYFSLEYGIHESIRVYSGGLGGLAGDHLKSCSDLDVPLCGVGILYRLGYFQQYLNNDGWQQEAYPENEIHHMPLRRALDQSGQPVQVAIPLPGGELKAAVWQLDVGQVPLYMLDSNIPDNPPDLRKITAHLYGGDRQVRLRQELLLGIGGFKALVAMGHEPIVCHMNEGHAAFMPLARISHMMKTKGIDLDSAVEIVTRTNVFTTHTPVPAGNEAFAVDLLRPHLDALKNDLGMTTDQIVAWGQSPNRDNPHELSMTILGLKLAEHANGVSQLHGKVERHMWANLWPGCPEDEIPIGHVTNGVHVPSWISAEIGTLFDRYLGPEWRKKPSDPGVLTDISQIPDEEIWRAHELGRARLIRITREMYEKQLTVRNASRSEIAQAKSALDYDVLTIGFARRFATYKRATMLLRDPDRLEAMLKNQDRPIQFIFAGKAHPADDSGKNFIRQIVHFGQRTAAKHRFLFLENYDIHTARYMVQGVDVWLNNPRRPYEASGTSGMKAAVNGVLHASVLDGWWCEGYSKDCGWAIGHGEEYEDWEYQDTVESQAVYNMLENEIVPTFYDRPVSDVPTRWVAMMRASIKMALGNFSSHRMVSEYVSRFYQPAIEANEALLKDSGAAAKQIVEKRKRFDSLWDKIKVELPSVNRDLSVLHIGDKFTVTTTVHHGNLTPDELDVEVYYGPVNSENNIVESHVETMNAVEEKGRGVHVYSQEIVCRSTGRYGFTTRVRPSGAQIKRIMPGYVTWADGQLP